MNNFSEKVNFIWSIADLIRDAFKRSKYQDVILPFTVLRRIDCVLQPTKEQVLAVNAKLKGKLENLAPQLCRASGYAFYNTSRYDFERLLNDAPNLAANLRAYINGFSDNMREVLEKFDFNNTIAKLDEAGLLFLVMEKFKNIDLHPDKVPNLEMGYIFEELIGKFNEALNENPGEHFTPREVIRLMVNLLLAQDQEALQQNHIVRTVYDPCCGSGGMLTIAKDRTLEINPHAEVHLFGQEVNGETFAICKSDLYMKSADGRDAENIKFGSTLSKDQHAGKPPKSSRSALSLCASGPDELIQYRVRATARTRGRSSTRVGITPGRRHEQDTFGAALPSKRRAARTDLIPLDLPPRDLRCLVRGAAPPPPPTPAYLS